MSAIPVDQIDKIVDYLWADEKLDYEGLFDDDDWLHTDLEGHIFVALRAVNEWLSELRRETA